MGPTDWFAFWFGAEYKRLYPHRDREQAAGQVAALLRAIAALPSSDIPAPIGTVLDVGCGAGRHLAAFRELGGVFGAGDARETPQAPRARIFGIDLSAVLLRDARAHGCDVARADMRRLPFADDAFDLVTCFFTSFGYFATPAEDAAALAEFVRVARPGGLLFLDLPNRTHVLHHLVPAEDSESEGRRVRITRELAEDCVIKRIHIVSAPDGLHEEVYEERVRLWSTASLGPVLDALGLQTTAVLGDERGAAFDPETSPRMSLVLRVAA